LLRGKRGLQLFDGFLRLSNVLRRVVLRLRFRRDSVPRRPRLDRPSRRFLSLVERSATASVGQRSSSLPRLPAHASRRRVGLARRLLARSAAFRHRGRFFQARSASVQAAWALFSVEREFGRSLRVLRAAAELLGERIGRSSAAAACSRSGRSDWRHSTSSAVCVVAASLRLRAEFRRDLVYDRPQRPQRCCIA
jgi:hypothetical protein